jgi:hypothetical protein
MATAGALGLGVGAAGTALAGTGSGAVTAVAHASDHPDTCACTTNVLGTNGYVWAYDNLARHFAVTPNGGGDYTVVVTDHGSFAAFAEPNNPDLNKFYPITATGSVRGTYTVDVHASQAPDLSALAPQYAGDVSTSQMIRDLFNGSTTSIVGGDYTYTYKAGGDTYTQSSTAPYITGDITGH